MMFLCILAAIVVFVAVWAASRRFRLQRLSRQRQSEGFDREQFIQVFRAAGIPDVVPAAVYDHYASQKAWKSFPFSPDDKYSEVLHDDPDDLDDDASALVQRLGLTPPPEYVRREFGDKPIKTLRDMVLWLDWIRQHQITKSESAS